MHKPPAATLWIDERPFELEFGAVLPRLEIAYETWGRLSAARDNAILICPAFSSHAHAQSSPRDPSPGWWEGMIGPGCAFDTERFFVVCASLLGGSFGTTGPTSIDPRTGEAYRGHFPAVSIRDIVDVHLRLVDHLGIERLFAAAGGSMGAMETLELAIRHPSRVARVIAISGTDFTRPYTAAIRHLGRRAIMLDPAYQGGFYDGAGPTEGLRLAREIGTLYYRGREEFNARFPHQPINPPSREGITFDVQSYLDHQGRKAVGLFDANSYLTLSLAMDLHDVWRGFSSREAALEPVTAAFQIVAVEEDRLIGVDEQRAVHRALVGAGKRSDWHLISSRIGHDAFLVELDRVTELVRPFLLG
ncbi:MAG: homoserine O-acetyltransferase [Acidobacteria bacterium]|nr:MAG: homoserine O-acetyltransferase [Acidobacteriota bacterium]